MYLIKAFSVKLIYAIIVLILMQYYGWRQENADLQH